MAADEGRVTQLAAAVLDGTLVDWAAAEAATDGTELPLVKHLRSVAALAEVHRTLTPIPTATSGPDGTAFEGWGHLRLIERIGSGTFGEVYRAWDTRLDREVALKLLPADRTAGDREASSIIHEGRLLARVRHPNVATIYGAEQIGDRIGLWMEFVRGRTLEQILAGGNVFSASEAARIGLDLCRAVSAVHAAGLLHRDIKAHNVMLADDGRVVLMDFGTGRELDDSSSSDLAGTPLYVAPEVLRGLPATVQSDVYSLGVLLYHLVTASYPVQGRTLSDVRVAHNTNSRADLRSARPGLPARLARVIERAIDRRPERRYQSADSLGAELQALSGRLRRGWLVAAAAAVLILLAVTMPWVSRGRSASGDAPAIAVLPFENRSPDPDGEVFADGLTDEIQRNLAAIQGLQLRSSTSSFAFKNKRDLREIRSQLGVDFILEGSVFRSGETLRVNARLVRVAGEVTLWAGNFDRKASDVFVIQDEISLAIVDKLRVTLGRGQRRYETDPDVYYGFLKARGLQARRNPENAARAAALFEQVVARDPAYAPAWAGLASALAEVSRLAGGAEMAPADSRLEPAALKAIQLDPLLAEAHVAMGNLYARNRDWVNARRSFLKALELNPSLTTAHTEFALSTLLPLGHLEEALTQLEAARHADPLSLDVRRVQAHMQVDTGRYNEAIENCRWVLERDPKFPYIDLWLARALIFTGRTDEARRILILEKDAQLLWPYLGYLDAVTGRRKEAEAAAAMHPDAPWGQMLIYGGLGDKDRAFDALERTADANWWRAATWSRRPEMAILRGDPRLSAFRTKLDLPE